MVMSLLAICTIRLHMRVPLCFCIFQNQIILGTLILALNLNKLITTPDVTTNNFVQVEF